MLQADVILLAAGFGKRLAPITESIPKPLVRVSGKPLIDWSLELLASAGVRRVFVNTHYLAEQIHEHLRDASRFGIAVEFSHEDPILDTGGAIKNLEDRLSFETILTINSDALLGRDFPLRELLAEHQQSSDGRMATLALREDPDAKKYGEVCVNAKGQVCRFLGKEYLKVGACRSLMYTGVSVLSREILDYMPSKGSVFSLTQDTYVKLLENDRVIQSLCYAGYFCDVGTKERLEQAEVDFKSLTHFK